MRMRPLVSLVALLLLSACGNVALRPPTAAYRPVEFGTLQGWSEDNLAEARPALERSCARILRRKPEQSLGAQDRLGTAGDWQPFCTALPAATTTPALRSLIERELRPYALASGPNQVGLFTGYYEASLRGSRTRQGSFQTPIYGLPRDLVTVNLQDFKPELKGQRLTGRVVDGKLQRYPDRRAIMNGALKNSAEVLAWVDDPVDAFFVQIQGSGRIALREGGALHIGYAGRNGHPYHAIGKTLVERGALKQGEVTMQKIIEWLKANPREASAVMNTNPSFVFFKVNPEGGGPVGASNVTLTPERSLAVDYTYIGHHMPVWLQTDEPKLNRLMVAQDTGGAIKGIIRGDVFWGFGSKARETAGAMKSRGRYFVLLPKSVPAP